MRKKVASMTFTAPLLYEYSWGQKNAGKHESTMTLYVVKGAAGELCIEWEVPTLDECVEINVYCDAERTVYAYDRTMALPVEAVALLRANGFTVPGEMA